MSSVITPHVTRARHIELNANHLPEEEYQKLDDAMSYNDGNYKYTFFTAIYEEGVFVVIPQTNDETELQKRNTREQFPVLYELLDKFNDEGIFMADFVINGENIRGLKKFEWGESEEIKDEDINDRFA